MREIDLLSEPVDWYRKMTKPEDLESIGFTEKPAARVTALAIVNKWESEVEIPIGYWASEELIDAIERALNDVKVKMGTIEKLDEDFGIGIPVLPSMRERDKLVQIAELERAVISSAISFVKLDGPCYECLGQNEHDVCDRPDTTELTAAVQSLLKAREK